MKLISLLLLSIIWIHSALAQRTLKINLDGKLDKLEWANAQKFDLKTEGRILLLKTKSTLHVALQGNEPGWAHVYLFCRDTVHVLHASAALGAVKYYKKGDVWFPLQSFKYTLRDTVYNDTVLEKQDEYLARHDWVANNNSMGDDRTLEFKIDLNRWNSNPLQMAFVFQADSKKPQYYPHSLADDTLLEDLVYGNTHSSLRFETKSWLVIR